MKQSEALACDLIQKMNNENVTVKKLEMRGIPKWEFKRYLRKIADKYSDDSYYGNGWQVTLSEEFQESLGAFSIIGVDVTIEVEKEKFEDFLLTFRKNFLRGGG